MSSDKEALSPFAHQLGSLIQTFAIKCEDKEDTQDLLSELLDQALHGGVALGYHPVDLIDTMRQRAKELATRVQMVCQDCRGKGTVPATLGPVGTIYDCNSCKGVGSHKLRVEHASDTPMPSGPPVVTKPESPQAKSTATDPYADLTPAQMHQLILNRRGR